MKNKQGSATFIQKLFNDHNKGLLKFLTRKLADPEEAADVAQSAYQKIMAMPDAEKLENPKGYLYQTAVNLAIDRIRKAGHREAHLQLLRDSVSGGVKSQADSPESLVSSREELERINAAIQELPEKCRRVFLMHRGGHMTYAEIADALDISVSMIEKYMIQALRHLRQKVD